MKIEAATPEIRADLLRMCAFIYVKIRAEMPESAADTTTLEFNALQILPLILDYMSLTAPNTDAEVASLFTNALNDYRMLQVTATADMTRAN